MSEERKIDELFVRLLDPDEVIHARMSAIGAEIAVTNRRLVVTDNVQLALDVAIREIRRIEFDIERDRLATLVIVPQSPRQAPQVLAVAPEQYQSTADALVLIGQRMAAGS